MAENENRVSAVQEAPDSPQEPAALDTPPSEMPVYEPARPVRRVGTLTMGLALVVVGAALCVGLFFPNVDFLLLFKLSPLVLVALGCEVIFAASTAKGMRLKYDFLSMFVCFLLIVTALGAACVPVALRAGAQCCRAAGGAGAVRSDLRPAQGQRRYCECHL